MLTLYPAIAPYATYNIFVDDLHTLYVEESGNKNGIPIIYIHGGPGSGCDATNRCFFDPEKYRIILFDQRGAGKSTPFAELKNNNTQLLIKDLEKIRNHCGIDQWVLFGGSWGSTLAILYAEAHPTRVVAMILRGIFLARQQDIDWAFKEHGAAKIFPEHWQEFIGLIPKNQKKNLIAAYYKILTGKNEIARITAAKAWSRWEAVCATLDPCPKLEEHLANIHVSVGLATIGCHYAYNKYFIEENEILTNIKKIKHIPSTIIHGRYDVICPLNNAYDLHKAWPGSELIIIRDAGHSSKEPGILNALIHATNWLKIK